MARRAGGGEAVVAATPSFVLLVLMVLARSVVAEKIYGLTLVKCHCQGNEVKAMDGSCLEEPGGTTVITETGQVSTSRVSVEVRPLECPHHRVTLVQGDVHLRHRGDWVVLRGPWRGLRINNYCLTHYFTNTGFLTWRLNICIPPPTVPRCCPEGQLMQGEHCVNSTFTAGPFNPPLLAGPGERPIKWPGQTDDLTPLASCTNVGRRVQQVLLGRQAERRASVIALPTGLVLVTKRGSEPVEYTFAPDFCIDAGVNHQQGGDNATYFAFYCDMVRVSDLRCNDTNVCVRKCCGEGQAMLAYMYPRCVDTNDAFIAPFEADHPKEVHVLVGLPPCRPIGHVAIDKGVDQRGGLVLHGRRHNASEYCLDNFIRGNTSTVEALVCIRDTETTGWASVRLYVTPVFLAVSAVAAVILLALMWLLPELRRDGGQAQASHAVAILLATLTLLVLQVPSHFSKGACIFMAVLLHYSFMAMFTWVAILSLVLWKRVRNIAGSGGGPPIEKTLMQQCIGWGIPLIVVVLNVTIHFTVPEDQSGVVHPRIAQGRCWYAGNLEVILYFYLPILVLVVTSAVATGMSLWRYCTMTRESISMSGLGDQQPNVNSTAADATTNAANFEADTQELHQSFNYTHEIRQHSILVGFAAFFWLTEGLSMEIKPVDIWSLADIINSLYGLVALLVFILNPNKWKYIQLQELKSSFLIKIEKITKLKSLCIRNP